MRPGPIAMRILAVRPLSEAGTRPILPSVPRRPRWRGRERRAAAPHGAQAGSPPSDTVAGSASTASPGRSRLEVEGAGEC